MEDIAVLSAGRSTPPELRARLALGEDGVRAALRAPFTGELAILSTCHRTELYFTGDATLATSLLPDLASPSVSLLRGEECVRHLYRVASGLDSLAVGEPQILTQVRRAFTLASAEGASGPVLSHLFSRAIGVGRAVRARTSLGSYASSIGTLAAAHVAGVFGSLRGRRGVVIGSGAAATDAATALRDLGAELSIAGRSRTHASRLAARVGADAFALEDIPALLARADFAVVAVSGGVVLRDEHLTSSLPIVDLSVPRAVEVSGTPVTTVDELNAAGRSGLDEAIAEAETLVDRAVAHWAHLVERRTAARS